MVEDNLYIRDSCLFQLSNPQSLKPPLKFGTVSLASLPFSFSWYISDTEQYLRFWYDTSQTGFHLWEIELENQGLFSNLAFVWNSETLVSYQLLYVEFVYLYLCPRNFGLFLFLKVPWTYSDNAIRKHFPEMHRQLFEFNILYLLFIPMLKFKRCQIVLNTYFKTADTWPTFNSWVWTVQQLQWREGGCPPFMDIYD